MLVDVLLTSLHRRMFCWRSHLFPAYQVWFHVICIGLGTVLFFLSERMSIARSNVACAVCPASIFLSLGAFFLSVRLGCPSAQQNLSIGLAFYKYDIGRLLSGEASIDYLTRFLG